MIVHVPLPKDVISLPKPQSGKMTQVPYSLPKGVISEEVTLVESTRKKYYDK